MTPYYERDGIQLFHCDCRELLPTLAAGAVDAVITDPPYGLEYDASKSTQRGIQKFEMIAGDAEPFDVSPFLHFPDVLVWGLPQLMVSVPVGVGAWYTWDKVTQNGMDVRISECEYAWHKRATKTRAFRHLWSGAYRASEHGQPALHPNQKPIALMEWCIVQCRDSRAIILDPFCGSGTTLLAAWRLGRKAIGCEISKKFCEVIKARLDDEISRGRLFQPEPVKETQAALFGDAE